MSSGSDPHIQPKLASPEQRRRSPEEEEEAGSNQELLRHGDYNVFSKHQMKRKLRNH